MSRKYKQRGYMDDSAHESKPQPSRTSKDVKSPRMPAFREVFRCAMCGTVIPTVLEISVESQCPKCKADLHSCKNCVHFDPASRFECTEPILERIPKKDLRNQCTYFTLRRAVERETSTSGSKIEDARKAFESLFKK